MSIFEKIYELEKQATSFVVITLLEVRGEAPQDPGAKAVITSTGLETGTVGGGKVEAAAIAMAQEILLTQRPVPPKSITWNLQKDIGMTCGGEVSFLFEHFPAKQWPIVIFGAGHVAQALTQYLAKLNCQVTCIDPRKEWIDKINKKTKAIIHEKPEELVKDLDTHSFFISMTKGHAFDTPILEQIAKHHPDCSYVGVIGSDIKGMRIKSELKELGIQSSFIEKLKVPIGLPIGSNDPYEISISIIAELIQVRDTLEKTL